MYKVKTLAKGQIVIPSEIRKKYRIERGTEMQIMEYGGMIYIIPPTDDPINAACGILPSEPLLSKKLIIDRQKDFQS